MILANSILASMNSKVDPCADFYQFACGRFINKTIIPEDKFTVDSFSIIYDDLEKQLNNSLAKNIQPNESKPFKMAKVLYKSCMNNCEYIFLICIFKTKTILCNL